MGVLALQGGYGLHLEACRRLGYAVREVRDPADLDGLGALILPGGESTTMGKLVVRRGLGGPLVAAIASGLPVFGTCAGAILLARQIVGSDQFRLGTLDATVERNAYGSQIDSFETRLATTVPGPTPGTRLVDVPAVFIRAPQFVRLGTEVTALAFERGRPVLVRQGGQVAATFHPELTRNDGLHRWFLRDVAGLSPDDALAAV